MNAIKNFIGDHKKELIALLVGILTGTVIGYLFGTAIGSIVGAAVGNTMLNR